ncbi:MAG: mannose-1-phosphate guanylyltransferase [Lentisphaeria bacterium]|nr:mannose-1-phosphate guanylyltransferase [Lentisphaeria bacterium]
MADRSNTYVVVMAGGRGERFWPQSRQNCPKQLLRLLGNLTLIEQTAARMLAVAEPENCLVITNIDYVGPMRSLLPMLPPDNIIGEPFGRDTGGCLALASGVLESRGVRNDAVVIATPADHSIESIPAFSNTLMQAVTVAARCEAPVLIGVKPEYASTGYGYIRCGNQLDYGDEKTRFFAADGFREKPSAAEAEEMLKEDIWRWNSGIFVWTHGVFKKILSEHAPELAAISRAVGKISDPKSLESFLRVEFERAPNISIDYALLEKLDYLVVAECNFQWADIGSWTALRSQIRADENNNVIRGTFAGLDMENCIVVSDPQHLIAAIDVKDLIIVNQGDVTLVCSEKSAQRVKDLVKKLDKDPTLRKFL